MLEGLRVLVVDDRDDDRLLMSTLLELSGVDVTTADSAETALRLLDTEPIDVLITDLAMLYEDGYSLLHQARSTQSTARRLIPAIAVSAIAQEMCDQIFAAGFQAFVNKPLDLSELISTLSMIAQTAPKPC